MKKILVGLFAASAMMAAQAADFIVIDLEKVVAGSTYLKQQNSSLVTERGKIEQLENAQMALQTKLKETKNAAEQEKLKKQMTDNAQKYNELQRGLMLGQQNIAKVFQSQVVSVAEQLRKEYKADAVLNKNSVLSFDAKYDLTDKMIQKVNAIK